MRKPKDYTFNEIEALSCSTAAKMGLLRVNIDTQETLTIDEVRQIGYLVHLRTAERWNPKRNIKYTSYFIAAVKRALWQAVRLNKGHRQNYNPAIPDEDVLIRECQGGNREIDPAEEVAYQELKENMSAEVVRNPELLRLLYVRATKPMKEYKPLFEKSTYKIEMSRMDATRLMSQVFKEQPDHSEVLKLKAELQTRIDSATMTEAQIERMCRRYLLGDSIRSIADEFGYSHQGIYNTLYASLWQFV